MRNDFCVEENGSVPEFQSLIVAEDGRIFAESCQTVSGDLMMKRLDYNIGFGCYTDKNFNDFEMAEDRKAMINAGDTVTFCIGVGCLSHGGPHFIDYRRAACTQIANRVEQDEEAQVSTVSPRPVFFFDRDPEIFRFVLDYYRTGELHLPSSICGPFVRKELIFWGIDESLIEPCCMPAYMRYDEEKRTKKTLFRDCFEDIDSMKNLVRYNRGLKQWRYRVWLFLDQPSSSLPAKMWGAALLGTMIGSFVCFCLSTHEALRRTPSRTLLTASPNSSGVCSAQMIAANPKMRRDCTTEPLPALVLVDVALNLVFSLEFLLKLLIAPSKPRFLRSSIVLLDVTIMTSYWLYTGLFYALYYRPTVPPPSQTTLWTLNVLSMSQALRILRIFKISKMSRGLRVLMLTIKKSIPELVLLAFLLMNGMFLFSSLIYVAEYSQGSTFPDIPRAFWWSIVTLTTVGYGDSYPQGGPGYLVGSLTAICGCILTGLAIPIIGNNFNTYYMYMKNQLKEDKYLREHGGRDHQSQPPRTPRGAGGMANGGAAIKFGGGGDSDCGGGGGGKNGGNNGTAAMYRRKFTTVDCPLFPVGLQPHFYGSSPPPPTVPILMSPSQKRRQSELSSASALLQCAVDGEDADNGSLPILVDNTSPLEIDGGTLNVAFSPSQQLLHHETEIELSPLIAPGHNRREDYV